MTIIVSEKGQITLPKALRTSLGIQAGAQLDVTEEDGHLVLKKILVDSSSARWRGRGILPKGFANGSEYLAGIRE